MNFLTVNEIELEKQRFESVYINAINKLENEIVDVETAIEKSRSTVKKELLAKKSKYLQERITYLDELFATNRANLDKYMNTLRKNKTSYEYNIQKLKSYRDMGGDPHILEPLVNIIEILREGK